MARVVDALPLTVSSNETYRLLLIEPSASIAAPIRGLLEQNRFLVDVVENIADARTRDLAGYAALIVDVRRDDLQFVQWLHQNHSHLVGRVVVISADDHAMLVSELEHLGVCDVVPKPVNAEEILRAVFECLELSPDFAVQ